MKCWKLETVYPNGIQTVEYYNLLRLALALAYVWETKLNCKCSLKYGDWRA